MALIKRTTKGAPLTHQEMDANLTELEQGYQGAQTAADSAASAASAADTKATNAQTAADSAAAAAAAADTKAVNAQAAADAAQTDATQALADAAAAQSTASGKQDALVSGTNLKTLNGESLLGAGNIAVTGGGNTVQTLTDAATVTWDIVQGNIAKVTLAGDRNLVVNGTVSGDTGILCVYQDETGGRLLSVSGVTQTTHALSYGAGELTILAFINLDGVLIWSTTNFGTPASGSGYEPETEDYFAYLSTQSTNITDSQKTPINDLVLWLKTEGLYTEIHDLWLIPSATSKAVAGRGFKGNLMGTAINDANFTLSASGLKGDGTKAISLGISPSQIGNNNHQISVYIQNKGTINTAFQIGTRISNLETGYSYISSRDANLYAAMEGTGTQDDFSMATPHANGMFTLTKPSGALKLVRNGVDMAGTVSAYGDDTLATLPYTLFGLNYSPSPMGISDATISFVCIGKTAMTVAQAQEFYNKVQAIQTAFNRAV